MAGWGYDWGYDWGSGEIPNPLDPYRIYSENSRPNYHDVFWLHMPPGAFFSREDAPELSKLTSGLTVEFGRIDLRATQIKLEINPASTNELLADWENFAGLPDACSLTLAPTAQQRRAELTTKLSAIGGQTLDYFERVAAGLGYSVVCEDTATPYVWKMTIPAATQIRYFRVGTSRVGEALRSWGDSVLECKINLLKPAHTRVTFIYA